MSKASGKRGSEQQGGGAELGEVQINKQDCDKKAEEANRGGMGEFVGEGKSVVLRNQ